MDKESTLMPCPFCGGKPALGEEDDYGTQFVFCQDCCSQGPYSDEILEAERLWNTRALSSEPR